MSNARRELQEQCAGGGVSGRSPQQIHFLTGSPRAVPPARNACVLCLQLSSLSLAIQGAGPKVKPWL
jgi:hypothetical protein